MAKLNGNNPQDVLKFLTDLRADFDACTDITTLPIASRNGETIEAEHLYLLEDPSADVRSIIRTALPCLRAITAARDLPKSCDTIGRVSDLIRQYDTSEPANNHELLEMNELLLEAKEILADEIRTLTMFLKIRQDDDASGSGVSQPNLFVERRKPPHNETVADQMLLLLKRDEAIAFCSSGDIAKILWCSSQAVRDKDNTAWKTFQQLKQGQKNTHLVHGAGSRRHGASVEADEDDRG